MATQAVVPRHEHVPGEVIRSWASAFKYRPVEFAERVIPFGEPGTPWESWQGLWDWQVKFLTSIAGEMREKEWAVLQDGAVVQRLPIQRAVSSCAGSGKTSAVLPLLTFWLMAVLPNLRAILISTTREQLMDRLFKNVKLMWESSPELQSIFALAESGKVWRRDMPNTTYATFRTAEKPEGMSGLHSPSGLTFVGFDESSGVSEAMRIAMSGACDDPQAIVVAVGNPFRNSGWFHRCHSGDLVDDWHPIHLARWDLPGWNEDLKAQLVRRHGGEDTPSYRAYVAGRPPQEGEGSFISMEMVEQAFTRPLWSGGERVVPENTPLVCGVDTAGGGKGYWCASFVAGLDGRIPPVMIQGSELKPRDRAQWMIRLLETPRSPYGCPSVVFYDATAERGQLGWELARLGYSGKFVPVNSAQRSKASLYANKRSEMWGGFRWWLESGGMLRRDDALARTIVAARHEMTPQGRIEIQPKEEIAKVAGRSRLDMLDSLMLACLAPPEGALEGLEVRVPERPGGRGVGSWLS